MEKSSSTLSPQQIASTQQKGRGKRTCKTKGSVQEAADKIRARARANRKTKADEQAERRLHNALVKQVEKNSKEQVKSLQLSPPKEDHTNQSILSQVGSDIGNLDQVVTNMQDSEMPGCSYWSNPVSMAHPLPRPVQMQHTETGRQLMPLVVQQWFMQLIGQGLMGGLQTNKPLQAESRRMNNYSIEEGEIESLSEEETEPEISDTKGLFKPHLFKALLAKAKSATGLELNKETPCVTHKTGGNEALFMVPKVEGEVIPSYEIFFNMVQRQQMSPVRVLG
ncbi:hypothetical protein E2320_017442 [Naja naja]|nr:hypothetical protein E2320_017442 [Naja naja]